MTTNTGSISAFESANVIFRQAIATVFGISLALGVAPLEAQQFPTPQTGVSVQLPSLRTFSVQTAVMVPDGGTMSLGGVSRSAEGRSSAGIPGLRGRPFRNSAIGRSTSSSRAIVKTRIISQRELEEDLLATGDRRKQLLDEANAALAGKPSSLGRNGSSLAGKPSSLGRNGSYGRSAATPEVAQQRGAGTLGPSRASSPAKRESSRPSIEYLKTDEQIEAWADFLAANIGRRR